MSYRVQFEGFVPHTGGTTDRALFNIHDGDQWVFAVVSGISYSALPMLQREEDEEFRVALRAYAQHRIEQRIEADPEWVETSRGRPDVAFDFDSYDIDVDALGTSHARVV